VAPHLELVDGRCVVHGDPGLLCIVPHPNPDVLPAPFHIGIGVLCIAPAPYVEWHLEPDDKDAFGNLIRPLPESMHPMIAIDVAMLLWVKIRWIVKILPLPLSHSEPTIGLS